ncbi:(2Fe-2S)-binding protein [Endozoicomonas elysicola]|uniref:Xanthine dehydrogenase n=1 Tax=Endozoicomonas elysicola TaxID=305900 RepID=A0A081KGW1_9GAMM|nr:xanthine dehydrogenase [Endozoicomonas elysicola]
MKQIIQCQLNGKPVELVVDVRQSLLEALRAHGLTGCKEGCGVGECGACTVLIDEVPIDSCITLAIRAEGRTIRTVEGESINGELSPVQQAYVDAGAVQCGFCTPGLVMKTTSYVEGLTQSAGGCCQSGNIDRDTIRREHAGNLCRCTGYQTVVDAVEQSIQYYSGQK